MSGYQTNGVGHSIASSALLPNTVAGLALALGLPALTIRSALYRGIKTGRFVRLRHGLFDRGPAAVLDIERADAVLAVAARETQRRIDATWPMDEARHAAVIKAYSSAVARRLTGAQAADMLINALRFGTVPD